MLLETDRLQVLTVNLKATRGKAKQVVNMLVQVIKHYKMLNQKKEGKEYMGLTVSGMKPPPAPTLTR